MSKMSPEIKKYWKSRVEYIIKDLKGEVKFNKNHLKKFQKNLEKDIEDLKLYEEELKRLENEGD